MENSGPQTSKVAAFDKRKGRDVPWYVMAVPNGGPHESRFISLNGDSNSKFRNSNGSPNFSKLTGRQENLY